MIVEKTTLSIEVSVSGVVMVREVAKLLSDEGKEISQWFELKVISHEDDYSNEPENVKSICETFFKSK